PHHPPRTRLNTQIKPSTENHDEGNLYAVVIDISNKPPCTPPFTSNGSLFQTILPTSRNSSVSSPSGMNVSPIGSVAFIELGDDDAVAVSRTVAESLTSLFTPSASTGNTGIVQNPVSTHTESAGTAISGTSTLGDLGAGLITLRSSPAGGGIGGVFAAADMTPVPNPEPASLVLVGTGMILIARRYISRPR